MPIRSISALLVAVLLAPAASAQTSTADAIGSGYQRFHAGDTAGAVQHFAALVKQRPDDLAARHGWLIARRDQLEHDDALAPAFERDLDALITDAARRHRATARDTEAIFYLAQAHMLRSIYRFDADKGMWGAARDASAAKGYAETYLQRHPEHDDAYFVLGLYNYYVDIAPAFVKVLRLLLFLPSGNRVEGLKQLERVAAASRMYGPQAQNILVEIYSLFEGRVDEAMALAERLTKQHPQNDDFAISAAAMYGGPAVEDHDRAAALFAAVAARRRDDTSLGGAAMRSTALMGLASQRVEQWRIEEAVAVLTPTIDAHTSRPDSKERREAVPVDSKERREAVPVDSKERREAVPVDWVLPQFLLRRANYRSLLNDPDAASDVRRVLGAFKDARWQEAATRLKKSIDVRRGTPDAAIYASLIPANRLAAEGRWAEAREVYQRLLARTPSSAQIQYRLAWLDFATGNTERTLPVFTRLAADRQAPGFVRAFALLHVARAHDLAGRRELALKTYRQVVDEYENERGGLLARIGLIAPYKKPVGRSQYQ